MTSDFEKFAARAVPAIFVVLWSTGFIGTKYVLNNAEPLSPSTYAPYPAGKAAANGRARNGSSSRAREDSARTPRLR